MFGTYGQSFRRKRLSSFKRRSSSIEWFRSKGWGTVYLLQSETQPGLFKVGFTQRTTKVRRAELSRLFGDGLKIVYTVSLPHAFCLEQRALKRISGRWFGKRNRRGTEWFWLRSNETVWDIARTILLVSKEVRFEAKCKLSWRKTDQIRIFASGEGSSVI